MNNAGGSWSLPFEQWTLDKWQNMIDLNLRSVFVLSVAASQAHARARWRRDREHLVGRGASSGCRIVAPYGAAKAGVNNLTKTFAGAWTPDGDPGQLHRGRRGRVGGISSARWTASGAIPTRSAASSNAVGRAGRPEEIAYGILFLVSDASSFLSGETIYMGGGPKVAVPLA